MRLAGLPMSAYTRALDLDSRHDKMDSKINASLPDSFRS